MASFIEITDLHYRPDTLPPEKADILDGVSFTINQGQFIAVIGENGSGKTTLIKHINGLLLPTQGSVMVDGLNTLENQNKNKIRSLVGMVFQNPADQIVASTLEEDVAFGLENLNMPTSEVRKRVSEYLGSVGLLQDATRPPHLLSGGEMQKLALAGVLAREPEVILFDEPTSMLDPVTRLNFLQHLRDIHQRGMTIIYITQHMEETVIADQIVVLCDGKLAMKDNPQNIFRRKQILREINLNIPDTLYLADHFRSLGWEIPESVLSPEALFTHLPHYEEKNVLSEEHPKTPKTNVKSNAIEAIDLKYTYLEDTPYAKTALRGASVEIKENQIHGLAGTNGSGKSTLLQHFNGILHPNHGELIVVGIPLHNLETKLIDVIRKVGLVFQSPETQFFEVFVGDEIAYGPKQFKMDNIRERVKSAMIKVGLDFEEFKDRRLETLSGGEKRKVALASTLVLDQDILIFDEPTAGMDPRAREDLLKLFVSLHKSGKTIIISTHRLEELAQISQSISLMSSGKIINSGDTHTVLLDEEMINKSGLLEPLAVLVTRKLTENGWPIDSRHNITLEQLISTLKALSV